MTLIDKVSELAHGVANGVLPMFGQKAPTLPQSIALVLVPEFTMMPVTSAIEPLRLANRFAEKQAVQVDAAFASMANLWRLPTAFSPW